MKGDRNDMTIDEAIGQFVGAEVMLLNRNYSLFNNAILMAVDALREKEKRENPQPLTIEELKRMKGYPVYVVPTKIDRTWYGAEWCVMDDVSAQIPCCECWAWPIATYGDEWIAYLHRPKEVQP